MQAELTRYEPPAINFHLGETPPREPQGGGEHTGGAARSSINNNSVGERNPYEPWNKLGVFVLVIAALGLPINDLVRYAVLVICAVGICCGTLSRSRTAWLVAAALVIASVVGQILWAAPRIDEGHNVFLIDTPGGGLERGLPTAAFQLMAAEFNTRYPPEHRCNPAVDGCWRGEAFPQAPFAFSADSIYDRRVMDSRRVTGIAFADPVWLRLGFINEKGYNWNSRVSDIDRAARNGGSFAFLHRWRITMPWFVSYRFPAEFVGSSLCWRGEVLWERAGERFDLVAHPSMQCRVLSNEDIGRRIFGVSIKEEPPLAMRLDPTGRIRFAQLIECGLALTAAAMVIGLLVRWSYRRAVLAFALIAATLVVVFLNDASFLGGVRPFDSGDDGLVYDGMARVMLRHLLGGDIAGAFEGGEKVFYFTPGMRYLRMIEHTVFGETYLGYLSLVLLLPFLVWIMFRRFLPPEWAVGMTLIFVAIPIGVLFGSSLVQYVKWAARGFADPAAYILFLAGYALLVRRNIEGPRAAFAVAWGASFLFALALLVRPNIAPLAGVLLAGSGIAALCQQKFARLSGLCVGFLPVLAAAVHNWLYGGVLVLFTTTAAHPGALVMPPSAYSAALTELIHFNFGGEHVGRAVRQLGAWLAGPSESYVMAPVNTAAIVLVIRMALWREVDPWLRLTALAALIQQGVGLFYAPAARYYYLTWLLTLLVSTVWMQREGVVLFKRRFPNLAAQFAKHPARVALARLLRQAAAA